jgi:hypothetical protein
MIESQAMLTLWRRHTAECVHRDKGRTYLKCSCPVWADGYVNGKRTLRQSLKTRDLARARKKAIALESPDARIYKPVSEAVDAFLAHCESEGLQGSTMRKYRNSLKQLEQFCEEFRIDTVAETDLTLDQMEAFRARRGLSQVAGDKERQLLRQFGDFCVDHKWASENVAKRIKPPHNLKPNDVEPYTQAERSLRGMYFWIVRNSFGSSA